MHLLKMSIAVFFTSWYHSHLNNCHMAAFSQENINDLTMPAQAASYGYRMIGCGDFNPPEQDDPTLGGEPYYRWFGARDGILTVTATARYLSDPSFRTQDIATHDGDEATLAALHEAGIWPVNHHGCRALGGRQEVAQTMATANRRVRHCARFVAATLGGEIDNAAYLEACAAKRSLLEMGRIHHPEKVIADNSERDKERLHLPQHEMAKLNTGHGLHAEAFVVNGQRGTMLRPTEFTEAGMPVRAPVYGVDAHITGEVFHAIKGLYTLDRGAFDLAYSLHAGAIVANHITGDGGRHLAMHRLS
jgi:hypothetical protein